MQRYLGSQVFKFALQRRVAEEPGFNFILEDFKLHSVNLAGEGLVCQVNRDAGGVSGETQMSHDT